MFGMSKGLYFQTVNQDEEPDKLNDNRLDEKGDFLVSGERSAELNHCIKFKLILIWIQSYWNHPEYHQEDSQGPQKIFVLEQFEYKRFLS